MISHKPQPPAPFVLAAVEARRNADVPAGFLRECATRGLVLLFPVVRRPTLTPLGRVLVEREGGEQ